MKDYSWQAWMSSLYLGTNIPLNKTIDICVENLFAQAVPPQKFFRKNIRRSMLSICVLNSFSQFDSKYYELIDGVAMVRPLGPTLATPFLCHYEKL